MEKNSYKERGTNYLYTIYNYVYLWFHSIMDIKYTFI